MSEDEEMMKRFATRLLNADGRKNDAEIFEEEKRKKSRGRGRWYVPWGILINKIQVRGAGQAWSEKSGTVGLRVVSSSPTWGIEIRKKE